MLSFNEKVQEDTGMRVIDLLPKKVKRMIYRHQHQDKYKAALLMMKALRKDPDVISRGLSKQRIQDIAADHFGLNHREFAKILDRKTRYEEKTPARPQDDDSGWVEEFITEAHNIRPENHVEINKLKNFNTSQKKEIIILYDYLKKVKPQVNYPLIFDDAPKGYVIKIKRELQSLDMTIGQIKKLLDIKLGGLKFGDGSSDTSAKLKVFGIKNKTEFLEMMQTIGFYLAKPLDQGNYIATLKKQVIYGDYRIREFLDDWEGFVEFTHSDKELQSAVIMLCNGSHYYRQTIGFKKPYVIWTNITSYYSALKAKEGVETDIKPNTADCVLTNKEPKALYDALRSDEPVITDETTGKLSCNGVEWYQISLKKSKDGAKLGKLTTLIKGKLDVGKNRDESGIYSSQNEANSIWINESVEEFIVEGMFGDMMAKAKQLGKEAVNKVKKAGAALLNFTKRALAFVGKLMKKEQQANDRFINQITRGKTLNEKVTQKDQLDIIASQPGPKRLYIEYANKKMKLMKPVNNDKIASSMVLKPVTKISNKSIEFLVGNVISFGIVNKMIAAIEKDGMKLVNDLIQSMSMGDTKLPVVKVYGNPSKADVEVITVASLKQSNPKLNKEQVKILLVDVHPIGGAEDYFVINMYIFAELKDNIPNYHKISMKKTGSGFTYDIEGVATQPINKITPFKALYEV